MLVTLLLAGCGKSAPDGDSSTAGPTVPPPRDTPAAMETNPADGVNAAIQGLVQREPVAVWNYLPAEWQQELDELVRSTARGVDSRVWNQTVAVTDRAVRLVRERQGAVFRNEALRQILTRDGQWDETEVREHWAAVTELAERLLAGPLASHKQMLEFHGEDWLREHGPDVIRQFAKVSALNPDDPFQGLSRVEASFVKMEGDTAIIRMTAPKAGEPPSDFEFVQVGDRWIPATLAEAWPDWLESMRARVASMAAGAGALPVDDALAGLSRVDGVLAELEQTRTQDEFDQILLADVILPLGALVAALEPRPRNNGTGVVPGEGAGLPATGNPAGTAAVEEGDIPAGENVVRVVIVGRASERRLREIEDELLESGETTDLDLQEGRARTDGTEFLVSPVADVQAFAKTIGFGTVMAVDVDRRTITVQLDGGSAP